MAVPLLPPFRAVARRLRSRPPFFCVGPVTAHTLVDQDRTDFPGHLPRSRGIARRLGTRTQRDHQPDQEPKKRSRHRELHTPADTASPRITHAPAHKNLMIRVKPFLKRMQAISIVATTRAEVDRRTQFSSVPLPQNRPRHRATSAHTRSPPAKRAVWPHLVLCLRLMCDDGIIGAPQIDAEKGVTCDD